MATELGKAYIQIVPSAKGIQGQLSGIFGKEMPQAGNSAGSAFGSSLVGRVKGLIAAAGLGKILSESLLAGADLQQSLGGIETLFKDSAGTVIANAEQAYKTAGMSANQYMEMVTGFSASLLQGLGGDTAKAASIADTALTDMSDNANKMGTSMELIQNAYQGFAKQNYTMLDNLKLGYGGTKTEMQRLLADAQKLTGIEYNIDNLADVYSAIHAIQGEMGITGTTALEASTTFTGSLNSMKAAASDLLANLATGRDIGPSLAALGETFFVFVRNNLLPMVGNIFAALPETLSSLLGMAIQGLNLVADNADSILQLGVDLVTGLGTAIITALPYLAESAWNIVTALGEAIVGTNWKQIAYDTMTGLRSGLDVAAGEILGTDGDIVGSMLMAVESGLPDVLEKGAEMLDSLVQGISDNLPVLLDTGMKLLGDFVLLIVKSLPEVIDAGSQMLGSLVNGIGRALPRILASAGEIIGNLLSGLASELPNIIESGFGLIVNLIEGIGKALPDIIESAGEVAASLWETIKETDWLQVGKDIINGLIDGIGAMGGALWNAAQNIAKSALNAIKKFFGIASPSKVMRDEVGKFIPSGVAVGIEANTKPLVNSMNMLSDLTTESLQTDLSVRTLSGALQMPAVTGTAGGHMDVSALSSIMADLHESSVAASETSVSILRDILQAILGIQIGDAEIYQAVDRHRSKVATMRGGAIW